MLTPQADRDGLVERLRNNVREQYGAHGYPRQVHLVQALPKTESGKVRRVVLRALSDQEVAAMTQ